MNRNPTEYLYILCGIKMDIIELQKPETLSNYHIEYLVSVDLDNTFLAISEMHYLLEDPDNA